MYKQANYLKRKGMGHNQRMNKGINKLLNYLYNITSNYIASNLLAYEMEPY